MEKRSGCGVVFRLQTVEQFLYHQGDWTAARFPMTYATLGDSQGLGGLGLGIPHFPTA